MIQTRTLTMRSPMLSIFISVASICILVWEFWTGIAVIGLRGDRDVLQRSEYPIEYWMMMTLHTIGGVGLSVLAFMSGV